MTILEQLQIELRTLALLGFQNTELSNKVLVLEAALEQEKTKYREALDLFNKTSANSYLIAAWALQNSDKLGEQAKQELIDLLQRNV